MQYMYLYWVLYKNNIINGNINMIIKYYKYNTIVTKLHCKNIKFIYTKGSRFIIKYFNIRGYKKII